MTPIDDSRIPCTLSPAIAQLLLSVHYGKVFIRSELATIDTQLDSAESEHDPAVEVSDNTVTENEQVNIR